MRPQEETDTRPRPPTFLIHVSPNRAQDSSPSSPDGESLEGSPTAGGQRSAKDVTVTLVEPCGQAGAGGPQGWAVGGFVSESFCANRGKEDFFLEYAKRKQQSLCWPRTAGQEKSEFPFPEVRLQASGGYRSGSRWPTLGTAVQDTEWEQTPGIPGMSPCLAPSSSFPLHR